MDLARALPSPVRHEAGVEAEANLQDGGVITRRNGEGIDEGADEAEPELLVEDRSATESRIEDSRQVRLLGSRPVRQDISLDRDRARVAGAAARGY